MASAASRMDAFALIGPVFAPMAISAVGYAAWKTEWKDFLQNFLTGPGRTKRIGILLFVLFNWKNMPLAWTMRIFYTIIYHFRLRKSPRLGPKALFKPIISTTHTPILEIDYNLHKSNSTFFTDLDVSRTHLVSYLFRPSMRRLTHNTKSKFILDPKTGQPVKGPLGILLGSVQCSFHKEVGPYKKYEIWSKVLSWDRKWVYIVTHWLPKGTAKPTSWLDPGFSRYKVRGQADPAGGWERKILATAISKYVFKVGRYTVHPARILDDAEMLPERPGGWIEGSEEQVGDMSVDLSDVNLDLDGEWDWRRVEAQRRRGMEIAAKFHALDEAKNLFDGGSNGALALVGPG